MRLALRYFNRNHLSALNYFVSSYSDLYYADFSSFFNSSNFFNGCHNIFGKKRDSSVTVPFIVVRYGLLYYKSKQLASRYIKVTKIKVHHWITASFYHLRVSVDTWQDTTDEIIGKLGFIGVELTFFTIRSFDHECKHI